MPKARRTVNEPDYQDAHTVFLQIASEFSLITKVEVVVGSTKTQVIARAYKPGEIRRQGVIWQSFRELSSAQATSLGPLIYGAMMDVFEQAMHRRVLDTNKEREALYELNS